MAMRTFGFWKGEFGITFLVLPNPCWLLSRELLYTALTRHRDRFVASGL